MADEHPNCKAIETFLNQISSVSQPIARTERINDEPVPNGYTASYWDQAKGIGFTVIAWGDGHFKVVVELAGRSDRAEADGKLIARLLEP